ncbi:MAG: hemolysin family protein [Candidatus Gracilibacteria bacterium]|nr:hemolysin family protein [Candidatus Gracilibacteria bacterium]
MDPLLILLFIVLFLLSAFFSGTELALMSLPSHKIDSLVKQGKYGAKSLKRIKQNNDRLLITILIGNNLVNVYTASLATSIAINIADSMGIPQSTVIGISAGIITFLLLMFGEILPKSIASKNASGIALSVAPFYKVVMLVLYPIITFIEVIIRLFSTKGKVETLTDEELESFIDMGRDSGTLEIEEHKKIKSILELDDTYVDEIMTPRVKIEALSSDKTVIEAIDFFLSHTHSRIPIYTETIDKIDNFVTARDLLIHFKNGKSDTKLSELTLNKVMKIPLNLTIPKLLENFQNSNKIMSIVLDEYGGVAGLITIEDIVEEVFGEIRDETDKEVEDIKKTAKGTFMVEPDVMMQDLLDKFGLGLKDIGLDEKEFDGETISYIITHELERYPEKGETITFNFVSDSEDKHSKIDFIVTNIEDHKIGKIEVKKS